MKKAIQTGVALGTLAALALASSACRQGVTKSTNDASANAVESTNSTDVPMVANASNSMVAAPPMSEADRTAYMNRHGMGFGSIDTNSDGRVTLAEANAYARRPLTSGGDSDNDGAMSAAELARAAPEVRASMLRADTNGDGALSSAEIDAHVEARFQAGDANHDGGMTEQEMQAAAAAARPAR
jgi:hypothetical protein